MNEIFYTFDRILHRIAKKPRNSGTRWSRSSPPWPSTTSRSPWYSHETIRVSVPKPSVLWPEDKGSVSCSPLRHPNRDTAREKLEVSR